MPRAYTSLPTPAKPLRKSFNGHIAPQVHKSQREPDQDDKTVGDAKFEEKWDRITTKLVDCSAVTFILLLVPQIVKNAAALTAGNAASLAGLSWVGFLTALMGNTQLLGYFLDKGELSAAGIQAIGVLSNYAVLFQIAVAGHLPSQLPAALVLGLGLTVTVFGARALGRLSRTSRVWHTWQAAMAVLGIVFVPQVLWVTFVGGTSLLPAAISAIPAVILVICDVTGNLSGQLAQLWGAVSAWTATLLFCCQPVAQVASNFSNPAGVGSLSVLTLLLGTVGNSMMAPRALFTRDPIWITGTLGGSVAMGWGNMVSMAVAHSFHGIGNFTPLKLFGATAALVAFYTYVALMHSRAGRRAKTA